MSDLNFFDVWKEQLRLDCEREDKLFAFGALTDDVLKLVWTQGVHPSVKAIVEGATASISATAKMDRARFELAPASEGVNEGYPSNSLPCSVTPPAPSADYCNLGRSVLS